jgi:CRISPR-associated protein Cas2
MLILSYDITNNKLRSQFSKYIKQYGEKIQYSVYRINNSARVLQNIQNEIKFKYKKRFKPADSVYVFQICKACNDKILKYGQCVYEDKDVIIF